MNQNMLTGWKAIAQKLGVHPNTAISWYKKFKMPIDRTPTGKPTVKHKTLEEWLAVFKSKKAC